MQGSISLPHYRRILTATMSGHFAAYESLNSCIRAHFCDFCVSFFTVAYLKNTTPSGNIPRDNYQQHRQYRLRGLSKGVTMHRCIAILGPAIRVSYRDPSIAILKKKKKNFFFFFFKSHTWLLALFCPFCCPHTAWIVLCIFYCAIQGHFWLIAPFFFRSLR